MPPVRLLRKIRPDSTVLQWRSIVWAPSLSLFAACASNGSIYRIATSPDAINWTLRKTPNTTRLFTIAWSPDLGQFVAGGAWPTTQNSPGAGIVTSSDGIIWAPRSFPQRNSMLGPAAWSPSLSLWVIVSQTGTNRVFTSPDGITWTIRTASALNTWNAVEWSPGLSLFAAVSSFGVNTRVMTSPDGINWTTRTSPADNAWQSIAWSPALGMFAAVANTGTGNRVMTSTNGTTWTIQTSAADAAWTKIIWVPEQARFVAVAQTVGNQIMTSVDGVNWVLGNLNNTQLLGLAWSPSLGLFVSFTFNFFFYSSDLVNWTIVATPKSTD